MKDRSPAGDKFVQRLARFGNSQGEISQIVSQLIADNPKISRQQIFQIVSNNKGIPKSDKRQDGRRHEPEL
jgi:hypothetical protein